MLENNKKDNPHATTKGKMQGDGFLYAGQEATVQIRHGTMAWFKIGKGVPQGCILSLCLFKFYAEFSSVARSCLFVPPCPSPTSGVSNT